MRRIGCAVALFAFLAAVPATAEPLLRGDEALKLAFGDCTVDRKTVFLTDAQKAQAKTLSGHDIERGIVYPYVATCQGEPGGVGYFDVHRIRTKPQKILVVVSPKGTVRRIEILSFDEPRDYLPPKRWYAQYNDHALTADLQSGDAIRSIAGATMSADATNAAVRRVLALHQVLFGKGAL